MNAVKSLLAGERVSGKGHTPNRAVKALGVTSLSVTLDKVLKISDQNLVSSKRNSSKTCESNLLWLVGIVHIGGDTVSNIFASQALV